MNNRVALDTAAGLRFSSSREADFGTTGVESFKGAAGGSVGAGGVTAATGALGATGVVSLGGAPVRGTAKPFAVIVGDAFAVCARTLETGGDLVAVTCGWGAGAVLAASVASCTFVVRGALGVPTSCGTGSAPDGADSFAPVDARDGLRTLLSPAGAPGGFSSADGGRDLVSNASVVFLMGGTTECGTSTVAGGSFVALRGTIEALGTPTACAFFSGHERSIHTNGVSGHV